VLSPLYVEYVRAQRRAIKMLKAKKHMANEKRMGFIEGK